MPFPVRIDYDYESPPWATYGLIAANILALVAAWNAEPETLLRLALNYEDFAPWQLITATFLHVGVFHLLFNMIFLLVFGKYVEARLGWWKFLVVYAVCGIGGDLVWLAEVSLRSPHTVEFAGLTLERAPEVMAGASGAISGLMGFTVVAAPRADIRLFWGKLGFDAHLEPDWPGISAWFLIGGWFLFQLVLALAGWGTGIAATAHLGGFATGVGIALLLHSRFLEGTPWHLVRALAGGNLEEAGLAKTADKWKRIRKARQERQRVEAEHQPKAPPAPPASQATVALPTTDDARDADADEDRYARPPKGSVPQEPPPSNPFQIDE